MPSLWYAETEMQRAGTKERFPRVEGDVRTDVLIVGGGMTGILCAHQLAKRGVDCMVVEAERIGLGVTQNTTAKVTAQHGLTLSKLARTYDAQTACAYAKANLDALAEYRRLAARFDFDFEEKTAFVYSRSNREKLEAEARLYETLDIRPVWEDHPPIPVQTVGALGMPGQAQCSPLKLIYGLADGLNIHENSKVTEINGQTARTDSARIAARNILIATHYPMVNLKGLYFMKLYQHRSYLIALRDAPAVGAMYVDEQEDGHTFRDAGELVLLGGGGHKTGGKGGGWQVLRALAKEAYPQSAEVFAWAAQDCMSLDGMPYIGP
ncbi:MAG TPA: FAD-dependent oxidoreductase, partial [Clostridia bacterium]|nr:FAD-dependent oxidoreductase [Clostridia bacterium]